MNTPTPTGEEKCTCPPPKPHDWVHLENCPLAGHHPIPAREEWEEKAAEAVHDAYLTTCKKLGWEVKPATKSLMLN